MKEKANRSGMNNTELSAFCDSVALILDAGMPLYDGLETLAETEASEGTNGDMVATLSRNLNETGSFFQALEADKRWPSYMAEMAGIGERSGHLQDVMHSLSGFYQREEKIREATVNAVTYPLVLGGMLVVILAVMMIWVLPIFKRVLAGMGVGGAGIASGLMNAGTVIGWTVLGLMALLLIAAGVCVLLLRGGARQKVLNVLHKVFPPLSRVEKKLSAARVASVLSMMLSSGFPVEDALEMTPGVLTDEDAVNEVNAIRTAMENGESFSEAVAKTNLFEALHNRMIRMGIAAGREDTVMEKIAAIYEEQAEDSISHLIGIIEPSLVAALAVVIGAVLLALMLPMTGILNVLL